MIHFLERRSICITPANTTARELDQKKIIFTSHIPNSGTSVDDGVDMHGHDTNQKS